jgi:hypothetical protein
VPAGESIAVPVDHAADVAFDEQVAPAWCVPPGNLFDIGAASEAFDRLGQDSIYGHSGGRARRGGGRVWSTSVVPELGARRCAVACSAEFKQGEEISAAGLRGRIAASIDEFVGLSLARGAQVLVGALQQCVQRLCNPRQSLTSTGDPASLLRF